MEGITFLATVDTSYTVLVVSDDACLSCGALFSVEPSALCSVVVCESLPRSLSDPYLTPWNTTPATSPNTTAAATTPAAFLPNPLFLFFGFLSFAFFCLILLSEGFPVPILFIGLPA